MPDYQKMYYILFNAMSESCERMLLAMQQADAICLDENTPPPCSVPEEDGPKPVRDKHISPRRGKSS